MNRRQGYRQLHRSCPSSALCSCYRWPLSLSALAPPVSCPDQCGRWPCGAIRALVQGIGQGLMAAARVLRALLPPCRAHAPDRRSARQDAGAGRAGDLEGFWAAE